MIEGVITIDNVYLNSHCLKGSTKAKKLDVIKLRKLLSSLGFNPISLGTKYIIEELEFLFNNNICEIEELKKAYSISVKKHNVEERKVHWNIDSAIRMMKKYINPEIASDVFYWIDNYEYLSPRFFMPAMLDYLNENEKIYNKTASLS